MGVPISWVGQSLSDLHGRANSVSKVDGISGMIPACWLCGFVGRGLRKGTLTSACLTIGEKAVPSSSYMPLVPF